MGDWQDRAACKDAPRKEIFFPEDTGVNNSQEARAVCAACGVRQQCLEYAIAMHEEYGIWGGLNPRERRTMKTGAILRFKRCMFCRQMFTFAWVKGKTPNYCNDLCKKADRRDKHREWKRQASARERFSNTG